jgi:hypothetical protein
MLSLAFYPHFPQLQQPHLDIEEQLYRASAAGMALKLGN